MKFSVFRHTTKKGKNSEIFLQNCIKAREMPPTKKTKWIISLLKKSPDRSDNFQEFEFSDSVSPGPFGCTR